MHYLLRNGRLIDPLKRRDEEIDLHIADGRIERMGKGLSVPHAQVVELKGKVVAPGFIDMLGQSETTILVDPRLPSKMHLHRAAIAGSKQGSGGFKQAEPLFSTCSSLTKVTYLLECGQSLHPRTFNEGTRYEERL